MSGPYDYTIVDSEKSTVDDVMGFLLSDSENPMTSLIPRIESAKVGTKIPSIFDPARIEFLGVSDPL